MRFSKASLSSITIFTIREAKLQSSMLFLKNKYIRLLYFNFVELEIASLIFKDPCFKNSIMLEIAPFTLLLDCYKFCLSSDFSIKGSRKNIVLVIRGFFSNSSFATSWLFNILWHLTSLGLIVFISRIRMLGKMNLFGFHLQACTCCHLLQCWGYLFWKILKFLYIIYIYYSIFCIFCIFCIHFLIVVHFVMYTKFIFLK